MKKKSFQFEHGFLGFGKMARVILEAMLKNKIVEPKKVLVSRRNLKALQQISRTLKVNTTQDNAKLAASCRFVWLGVKPFQAREILSEIKLFSNTNTIFLSMMAGVSTKFLAKELGSNFPYVRLMPNTPAALGQGVTAVYFSKGLKVSEKNEIFNILKTLGFVVFLKKESDFDAITGLSGSGPAFVYTLVEGLIEGGKESGLSTKQARTLTLKTMQGAMAMLEATGQSPAKLTEQVVSKGGTTEAGLNVLKEYKTKQALTQAVKKATQRSEQISNSLSQKD